jgi:hypothetical protein
MTKTIFLNYQSFYMKKKLFIAVVVSAAFGFFSCQQSSNATQANISEKRYLTDAEKDLLREDTLIKEFFEDTTYIGAINKFAPPGPRYFGKIVPYKEAEPCIKLYEETMKKYGIVRSPVTTPITITPTLKITLSEIFRGKELKTFIKNAAGIHGGVFSNSKHAAVLVVPGIYTREFVANRDPSREGRIGMFLITHKYDYDTTHKQVFNDEIDNDAFDFGGIEP